MAQREKEKSIRRGCGGPGQGVTPWGPTWVRRPARAGGEEEGEEGWAPGAWGGPLGARLGGGGGRGGVGRGRGRGGGAPRKVPGEVARGRRSRHLLSGGVCGLVGGGGGGGY